jgi:hypothetical protein
MNIAKAYEGFNEVQFNAINISDNDIDFEVVGYPSIIFFKSG